MSTTTVARFRRLFPADPAELVLWGFHPSICDGEPLKLCTYSRAEQKRYEKFGYTCHAYKGGTAPAGLRAMAEEARRKRAEGVKTP